jgi:hypothetical protein
MTETRPLITWDQDWRRLIKIGDKGHFRNDEKIFNILHECLQLSKLISLYKMSILSELGMVTHTCNPSP